MPEKKVLTATWLEPEVKKLMDKLCEMHEVSVSRCIRRLIVENLDMHHLFSIVGDGV
jgi:hypothetical protein